MDENKVTEERYQVVAAQKDIRDIKNEVAVLSSKFDSLHTAIVGSQLAKDGGMVQRLVDLELELKNLELEMKTLKTQVEEADLNNQQNQFYIRIIWALASVIATTIFIELVRYFSPIYHIK